MPNDILEAAKVIKEKVSLSIFVETIINHENIANKELYLRVPAWTSLFAATAKFGTLALVTNRHESATQ